MSVDVIECDRPIAVDVRKERPADIIIAAINIDPRATDSPVAAVDRDLASLVTVAEFETFMLIIAPPSVLPPMLPPVLSI